MSLFAYQLVFLALLAGAVVVRFWLSARHIRHVRAQAGAVPEAFRGSVPLEAHQKAARYTQACVRTGQAGLGSQALIAVLWTSGGFLWRWDELIAAGEWGFLSAGTVFLVGFLLVNSLLALPRAVYRTFKVEERFGFNRTTPKLFVVDFLKETMLLVLIATPLAVIALWVMERLEFWWWLPVWAIWLAFQVFFTWIYPVFILPWFQKLTPLEDGALRTRIEELVRRTGFRPEGVFVMDGSRRSAHTNAFLTGIGSHKRVMLYDTLIESLDHGQLEAVVAHELGHSRLRHVPKMLLGSGVGAALALVLLALAAADPAFYPALGVWPSPHAALALFFIVFPWAGAVVQPLIVAWIRRFEFQADAFAREHTSAHDLVGALVRLYSDNATTLTPDPLYSAYHHTHPPPGQRVARLEASAGAEV
ncbi:MAG: M48 family metallopeptidase [Planctomycetota bacterium]